MNYTYVEIVVALRAMQLDSRIWYIPSTVAGPGFMRWRAAYIWPN